MAIDDDLTEFVGADKSIPAVPRPAPKAPAGTPAPEKFNSHPECDGLEDDQPPPRVTPYTPPEGGTHPKHCVLGPALRLDKAEHNLTRANIELTAATVHLRSCEIAESAAETDFMALHRPPSQEQTLRDYAANELRARHARVQAGLPPEGRVKPAHGKSVLDRIAANRPRPVAGVSQAPLRSNAVRR